MISTVLCPKIIRQNWHRDYRGNEAFRNISTFFVVFIIVLFIFLCFSLFFFVFLYFSLFFYIFLCFSLFFSIFLFCFSLFFFCFFFSNREWDKELERVSKGESGSESKPSLQRAMRATFGLEFMFYGLFSFIEECGVKYSRII